MLIEFSGNMFVFSFFACNVCFIKYYFQGTNNTMVLNFNLLSNFKLFKLSKQISIQAILNLRIQIFVGEAYKTNFYRNF